VANKSRWEVYSGDGGEEGGQIGEGKCTYVRSCARHCPKGAWGMASAAYEGRIKGDSAEKSKEPVDIFQRFVSLPAMRVLRASSLVLNNCRARRHLSFCTSSYQESAGEPVQGGPCSLSRPSCSVLNPKPSCPVPPCLRPFGMYISCISLSSTSSPSQPLSPRRRARTQASLSPSSFSPHGLSLSPQYLFRINTTDEARPPPPPPSRDK